MATIKHVIARQPLSLEAQAYMARIRQAMRQEAGITSTPTSPKSPPDNVCPDCGTSYYMLGVDVDQPGFGKIYCGCNAKDNPNALAVSPDPNAEYIARANRSGLNLLELTQKFERLYPKPGRQIAKAAALKVLDDKGWLTLHGGYGGGKSYLGSATINEGLARGLECRHWLMPLFLEELKKAFDPNAPVQSGALYEQALTADVLVIDECERFYATGWALERFTTLMLTRYKNYSEHVTVWITNLRPQVGQGEAIGLPELDALFSRMSQFEIVHMDDGDIRPALGRTKVTP